MQFAGFYNFGGGGTEEITGVSNENIPSHEENVCSNDRMFASGQFSNLSRMSFLVAYFLICILKRMVCIY